MNDERAGLLALIAAALGMIAVMAVHPSHVDQTAVIGPFGFSGLVHGVAILSHVLLAWGAWTLSRHLGQTRARNVAALAFAWVAIVMMINAAVISMFVTPAGVRQAMAADPAIRTILFEGTRTWVAANRGLAQGDVALLSIAIMLWSWEWVVRGRAALGWAGVAVGAAIVGWQLSGTFEPSAHTMSIVTLAQGGWLIAAARGALSEIRKSVETQA